MKKKAKKNPSTRVALLRLIKQVELLAESGRFELRTPEARERYALAQATARALGILLCCRNTKGLRRLGEPAEEFLGSAVLSGAVIAPHSRAEDFLHPNQYLKRILDLRTMIEEPDAVAEIPLFEKTPVGVGKKKTQRRAAAKELRDTVAAHIKRPCTFPEAGTVSDQLAFFVVAFVVVRDESPIGQDVRARWPAPRTERWKEHWRKMLTLVAKRIETVMQSASRPDPEAIVRAALDELGYSDRKNASLYEADSAREKYQATKAKPAIVH